MKRYLITLIFPCLLLTACHTSTTVTREEQLTHVTRHETTAPVSDATAAVTTAATTQPAATLPPVTASEPETAPTATETDPVSIQTAPPQTKPPVTTAPPPAETTPPSTAPETTDQTQPPETTVPPQPPETVPPETEPAVSREDPYDISGYAPDGLEHAIHAAINGYRADAGLETLELDTRLSAISSVRAYEASVSFKHTRPDGTDCFTVLEDYGYSGFSTAGENLLQCSEGYTAEDMAELWMGSSGHRANILSPGFTAIGIGVYRANGMIYVATIFVG